MLGLKRQGGFTLVEVAIIVLTLAILSAILVPNLGRLNAYARFIKVKEDLMVICSAMKTYLDDTGESAFYQDGNDGNFTPDRGEDEAVGLLIGDGDIANDNADDEVPDASDDPAQAWQLADGDEFKVDTDLHETTSLFSVDTFADHLIQNAVGYRTPQEMDPDDAALDDSSGVDNGLVFDPGDGRGFNSVFAWRGPYINDRVYPDPWGNRYMANVFALHKPPTADTDKVSDGYASAVVCISSGPDEQTDTAFNQPDGWTTGDDDQTVVLTAGGSIRP